jgi:TolA-binding protein
MNNKVGHATRQCGTDNISSSAADSRGVVDIKCELRRRRRHLTGFVLGMVIFIMWFPTPVMADKASDDFNLGVGFYRSQRYELAVDTFSMFLTEFPEHPRTNLARLYYALSLDSLEKYESAREQFAAFLRAEPDSRNSAEARYRIGECSYYLKDYPAAIEQLSGYLEKHPDHSRVDWAKLFLGEAYSFSEEWAKAEAILKPLADSEATHASVLPEARLSLGLVLEQNNQTPEALERYKLLIAEKNPVVAPRALLRMGAIQFAAQQYAESAATYEQLLATWPASGAVVSANLGAGKAWYRAGEFETALQRFRAVPEDSVSAGQAILMAAMSLRDLGRVEESRREFAAALKAAGDSPLAADILFQQAQLERSGSDRNLAAQLFEDIADRWPQSEHTTECLFDAAELRLELNELERAERIFARLQRDFPEAAERPREKILAGRLFLARGELPKAISTLQQAVDSGKDPADPVVAVGRYYLIRALFDSDMHEQVVQQVTLLFDALKSGRLDELRGALGLAAISSLNLKQFDNSVKFADEFLLRVQDADKQADIKGTRAVALSHLNRFPEAIEALKSLAGTNADQPQTWTAVLQAAEAALEQGAPDSAEALFMLVEAAPENSEFHEAGLSGIAWSQFRGRKYAESEMSFAKLVAKFPDSRQAAQAIFMQARCVEEQGDLEKTADAFKAVFDQLTQNVNLVPAGGETMPPMIYAFDAGKQRARSLAKLKRPDDADLAWKNLTALFPDAAGLDALLDEWAWMNFSAKRFEQSDAVHRLLLEKFPDSAFAGQARLSLAESLLEAGQLEPALKEMDAIVADSGSGDAEKERALFHVIEIQAAARKWLPTVEAAKEFLARFSTSPLAPQVRQFTGDALLQQGNVEEATGFLDTLRSEIVAGTVLSEDWVDRVWVVSAEAALARKDYEQIDALQTEMKQRSPESPFAFQLNDVQGRRWKQQAPPDFAKARQYFQLVTADPLATGTETSARCQFLTAETFLMESNPETAAKEFFKVYLNYAGHDELRAQALFQAASCQAALKKTDLAIRDFKEFIKVFPASDLVTKATEELKKLEGSGS